MDKDIEHAYEKLNKNQKKNTIIFTIGISIFIILNMSVIIYNTLILPESQLSNQSLILLVIATIMFLLMIINNWYLLTQRKSFLDESFEKIDKMN